MKTLPIVWQRLVSANGKTCERCGCTQEELQRAVSTLKEALAPMGIEPTFETREIDEASFKANPAESNRIWIAGQPMETWLGAGIGSSRCCSVCESECRTLEVGESVYETVPERLIVQAALAAASRLVGPARET